MNERIDSLSQHRDDYWSIDQDELFRRLQCDAKGLTAAEAAERLRKFGMNKLVADRPLSRARILARQLSSPLLNPFSPGRVFRSGKRRAVSHRRRRWRSARIAFISAPMFAAAHCAVWW